MPTQEQVLEFWGNARQAGYSDDEIREYAIGQGYVRERAPVLAEVDRRQREGLPTAVTPSEPPKGYWDRYLQSVVGGSLQMRGAYQDIGGFIEEAGAGLGHVPADVGQHEALGLHQAAAEKQERGSEMRGEALAPDSEESYPWEGAWWRRAGLQFAGASGEIADIVIPFEYAPRLAGRGVTSMGAKWLDKGLKLTDNIAAGMVDGLVDDVLSESTRLSEAIQVEDFIQIARKRNDEMALGFATEVQEAGSTAAKAAEAAHVSKVASITDEFYSNVDRMDELFPPNAARSRGIEKTVVPSDEASFLGVQTSLSDEAVIRGTQVEPTGGILEPPRSNFPDVETQLSVQRPSPVNRRHEIAFDAMERGYISELAEADIAYEAVQEIIGKNVAARMNRMNPGEWANAVEKIARREEAKIRSILAESGQTRKIHEHARKALDRTYQHSMESEASTVASRQFIGRVAQEKAGRAFLLDDVAPAEQVDKGGVWSWIAERSMRLFPDNLRGGPVAGFQEGMGFRTARRYKDKDVRTFFTDYVPKRADEAQSTIAYLKFKGSEHRRSVSSAVSRYAKRSGRPIENIGEMMSKARREGNLDLIYDAELRNAVRDAGAFIDEMSPRYIREGVVEPGTAMAEKFKETLGKYLHTSYATIHVKDWARQVRETSRWENAYKWFRESWPEMTDDEILGTMIRITERPKDVVRGRGALDAIRGDLPKPVFDELKHKTDLPEELRELFGVNKDFLLDFDMTTAKMIYTLEWAAFQRDILVKGLRNGTISRIRPKSATKAGGNTVKMPFGQIAGDAEYFVSPEMAELIGVVDGVAKKNQLFVLPMFNGLAKLNVTALSPPAQFRNLFAWPLMWMQAGVLSVQHPVKAANAWKLASKMFRLKVFKKGKFTAEEMRLVERFHELGMADSGIAAGTQDIWMEQIGRAWRGDGENMGKAGKAARELIGGKTMAVFGRAKKTIGLDKVLEAYRATDSLGKFVGWRVKTEQLKNLVKTPADVAYLIRKYGSGEIDVAAANYAKNVLQHFPYTPAAGRKLAKNPAVGTFVSFQLEVNRNLANRMGFLGADLAHAKELAAAGDVAGAARWTAHALSGFAAFSTSLVSWKAAQAHFNGVNGVDKRMEEAIRRRIFAPWSENNDMLVLARDQEKIKVVDTGWMNPYAAVSSMVNAMMVRPGDLSDRLIRGAKELEDIFLGREIFAAAALGAAQNRQTPTSGIITAIMEGKKSRPIARETDSQQAWERAYWFLKRTGPGALVRADKVFEAATDERAFGTLPKRSRAVDYSTWQEVAAMFGMPRVAEYTIPESLGYHYREALRLRDDLATTFSTRYRDNPTEETIARQAETWDKQQDDILLLIDDSGALGQSPREVRDLMVFAGFSHKVATKLARGEKVPFLDTFKIPEDR